LKLIFQVIEDLFLIHLQFVEQYLLVLVQEHLTKFEKLLKMIQQFDYNLQLNLDEHEQLVHLLMDLLNQLSIQFLFIKNKTKKSK